MDFSKKKVLDAVMENSNIENHDNVILGECNEIKLGLQVNSEEKACNTSIDYLMFSFTKNA